MHEHIEAILEAGNSAPSGENCQPWHFVSDGNSIEVHVLPERDTSYYGWGQRASYMANGAVIENIVLAASQFSLRADVSYLPEPKNPWHAATITFEHDVAVQPDPLTAYIPARTSNRKKYAECALSEEQVKILYEAAGERERLKLVRGRDALRKLARVGAVNEEVMLSNEMLHGFFFSHINWTKEEDDAKKVGFYIKTLELPAPAVASFKLIQHWNVMRIFTMLGFPHFVGTQNASTYAASAAIGAITLKGDSPFEYIKGGRTLERVWLAATSLSLSLQPLTGVLFFMLKIDNGEGADFSPKQRELIGSAYHDAQHVFDTQERIGFMFRVGHGEAPTARASRFPLSQVVTFR